jgi:hypothetical protein
MKRTLLAALLIIFTTLSSANAQSTLYGLTNTNAVFSIKNVNNPYAITGPYAVTGIVSGQVLVGLGVRTGNGQLYALGYDSVAATAELYIISRGGTTYYATAVSGALASVSLGLTNNIAFHFVPTMDNQIRIVGRNGNNYIMNADNGTVSYTGTSGLSFAADDLRAGVGVLAATAYTNNFYGSDVTSEVGYDALNNVLVTFGTSNFSNGFNIATNSMRSLGATTDMALAIGSSVGMDTWFDISSNHNILFLAGNPLTAGAHLYTTDISEPSGTLTDLGPIGTGTLNVRSIAFQTHRDSASVISGYLLTGLTLNLRNLIFFDSQTPETIRKVVTPGGITAGQRLIGIDYSTNGLLYGLGYNSSAQNYQLYTIDTASGYATAVNLVPASLNLGIDDGSGNFINASMRFLATDTSRIKIVGNNGNTNVTLSAFTGMVASNDTVLRYITGDINFGGAANLTSIAYTGYGNDTVTQLFGYDANTGNLVTFDFTNTGGGFGDGSNGYISTGLNLNSTLLTAMHTPGYNNSYLNIAFDNVSMNNVGFIAANYLGDSGSLLNYSALYDMSGMLTAYNKGTATAPEALGRIGTATPVKDITLMRASLASSPTGLLAGYVGVNDLLVYPNPASNTTNIALPVTLQVPIFVQIINLNGNIVRAYEYPAGSNLLNVDMSTLPLGLYSVRVSGKYLGTHNISVVKQ